MTLMIKAICPIATVVDPQGDVCRRCTLHDTVVVYMEINWHGFSKCVRIGLFIFFLCSFRRGASFDLGTGAGSGGRSPRSTHRGRKAPRPSQLESVVLPHVGSSNKKADKKKSFLGGGKVRPTCPRLHIIPSACSKLAVT